MTHKRRRYIEHSLDLALQASTIVGILGQRQTGKSTLVSQKTKTYITLDSSSNLAQATTDPEAFLLNHEKPLTIDECQLAPPLFPELKEYVRKHPKRGQFLLSGWVRFTSRKAIQESLTGRILTLELLPFTLSEMHGLKLHNPTDANLLNRKSRFTEVDFKKFIETGGMPGISFRRNTKMTDRLWNDHLNTLLDRDVRLIIQTSVRVESLRKLLQMLAMDLGQALDISKLSRLTRISRVTLGKLISAFEAMFLIRLLPCEGGISTPRVYFEDVGMAYYLGAGASPKSLYQQGFYQCARGWFFYSTEKRFEFFEYMTRSGHRVDLAVRDQGNGKITGWIFAHDSKIEGAMLTAARLFLGEYGVHSQVMIIGPKLKSQTIDERIFAGAVQNLI